MKDLEFIESPEQGPSKDPTKASAEISFRDIVLKEPYRARKTKWKQKSTWVRFLPRLKGSEYEWMMRVEIVRDMGKTSFVHPKTFDESYSGPIEEARQWLFTNDKGALQHRDRNPKGYKLWTNPIGIAWLVDQSLDEGSRLRVFTGSLNNGENGGTQGIGHQIWKEAISTDNEPGSETYGQRVYGDITHPLTGRLVCVEKTDSKDSEYAQYSCKIGKNAAPIADYKAMLTPEEIDLAQPLENILYVPTDDEILGFLRRYLSSAHYTAIFGNRRSYSIGAGTSTREEEEDHFSLSPATHEEADDEPAAPTPTAPKATSVAEAEEPTPAPKAKPAPKAETAPEPDAEPTASAEGESAETRTEPYSVQECMKLVKTPGGIKELLRNLHLLNEPQQDFVKAEAKKKGVEL
jgi:hypothetical protein